MLPHSDGLMRVRTRARLEGHAQFHGGFDDHHAGRLGGKSNQVRSELRQRELAADIRVLAQKLGNAGLS